MPNEAGTMTDAIDIFTASSSTDFAYAYTTYSRIVLSHCDLVPGICFVCVNVRSGHLSYESHAFLAVKSQ